MYDEQPGTFDESAQDDTGYGETPQSDSGIQTDTPVNRPSHERYLDELREHGVPDDVISRMQQAWTPKATLTRETQRLNEEIKRRDEWITQAYPMLQQNQPRQAETPKPSKVEELLQKTYGDDWQEKGQFIQELSSTIRDEVRNELLTQTQQEVAPLKAKAQQAEYIAAWSGIETDMKAQYTDEVARFMPQIEQEFRRQYQVTGAVTHPDTIFRQLFPRESEDLLLKRVQRQQMAKQNQALEIPEGFTEQRSSQPSISRNRDLEWPTAQTERDLTRDELIKRGEDMFQRGLIPGTSKFKKGFGA